MTLGQKILVKMLGAVCPGKVTEVHDTHAVVELDAHPPEGTWKVPAATSETASGAPRRPDTAVTGDWQCIFCGAGVNEGEGCETHGTAGHP